MDLKEVGHTIQIVGAIFNSDKDEKTYLLFLPDEDSYQNKEVRLMSLEEWKEFFWQADVLEIEVKGEHGKATIRKSQRQIDTRISWKVFERDGFKCRYCGKIGIPLTVDHVVLWEDGGPSIEENLLSACRKCNRIRGNMKYADWLISPQYDRMAKDLSSEDFNRNHEVLNHIDEIPISFVKMRGKKR